VFFAVCGDSGERRLRVGARNDKERVAMTKKSCNYKKEPQLQIGGILLAGGVSLALPPITITEQFHQTPA